MIFGCNMDQRSTEPDTGEKASARGLLFFAAALALAALGVSGYLSVQTLTGQAVAGCGGVDGCGAVLASPWSKVFGLPVSLLGSAAYLAVLIGLGLRLQSNATNKLGDFLLLAAAPAMLIAAAWYTYIQFVEIEDICPYCMVDHGIGVVLAVLLPILVFGKTLIKPAMPIALGCVGIVGLLAVQHFTLDHNVMTTKNHFVDRDGDEVIDNKRMVSMFGGELQFAIDEVPHYGDSEAKQVVGLMFDYACPHCRKTHRMINEAIEQDSQRFVVVPLPITILQSRNPHIFSDLERFDDSEERALLAQAVAAVDFEKWRTFDRWLFSYETAPWSAEEARAKAVELIGEEALSAQLAGETAEQHRATIQSYIDLLALFAVNGEKNPDLRIPVVTAPGAPYHIHEGFYDLVALEKLLEEAATGLESIDANPSEASP